MAVRLEPLMLVETDDMFDKIHISMSLYATTVCIIRCMIGNIGILET